jgi:hypothetical protein
VEEGRKGERAVDGSVGEACQLLGDVTIDEGISEVTKDKHEEREGHTMANGKDGANEHQQPVKHSSIAKLKGNK